MTIRKILIGSLFAAGTLLCAASHAELYVKDYEAQKKANASSVEIYLYGVGVGFTWMQSFSGTSGNKPFYCPPPNLVLNAANYTSILEAELKTGVYKPGDPVEPIMLLGLTKTFSCLRDKSK